MFIILLYVAIPYEPTLEKVIGPFGTHAEADAEGKRIVATYRPTEATYKGYSYSYEVEPVTSVDSLPKATYWTTNSHLLTSGMLFRTMDNRMVRLCFPKAGFPNLWYVETKAAGGWVGGGETVDTNELATHYP